MQTLLFEGIPVSPKLELYRANQDQIRNQRPRLSRNTLFLGRKAGRGVNKPAPKTHLFIYCNGIVLEFASVSRNIDNLSIM